MFWHGRPVRDRHEVIFRVLGSKPTAVSVSSTFWSSVHCGSQPTSPMISESKLSGFLSILASSWFPRAALTSSTAKRSNCMSIVPEATTQVTGCNPQPTRRADV